MRSLVGVYFVFALFCFLGLHGIVEAQVAVPQIRAIEEIDEARLTTLKGNTHQLARAEFDRGAAPSDLPMQRMLLVLTPSAEQQAALENLLKEQQDKSSVQYHQWLTPEQFGQQFGAADEDIQTVTAWLASHGFQVSRVSNGRNRIEFSGTASQVQAAFHTEIHKYVVNGVDHWANASDPKIPSALAPVVTGVTTLHNFGKKPQLIAASTKFTATYTSGSKPLFDSSGGSYALAPADFATIYNLNPLYQAGIAGSGATIAVVARTNISVSDINSFRSTFGLSNNPPQIVVNGTDPGNLGGSEEAEAVLDTTWSGAVATAATIKLVVSASTNTTDGVDLSEEYIIDNNLGDVMTESFGDCEANYTAAEGSFYSSLAKQAASEGITYAVAAGDSGAEGCDDPSSTSATGPVSVNILASTPYDIAVGGTEFNENGNYSQYWSSTNGTNDESALSYIPENVWNESCTVAQCGSVNAGLWAGGGGVSSFFSKPSWQSGVSGIPNDFARDVPDVALTAAGHDPYLLCLDNSCTPNRRGRISFQGYAGTSAATPSFAGIMALVVQKTGSRQGQADYVLYSLAAKESWSSCNASNTSGLPASSCIFNDVTSGNNAVPGESGYGTSSALYQAGVGYDLTTGLGSVNATNLLTQWNTAASQVPELRLFIDLPSSQNSVLIGQTTFAGWSVSDTGSITKVAISIDGVPYGNAVYGASRPDVCTIYPGRTGCPNVGWSFAFDTAGVADGTHTLDVTATSSAGQNLTMTTSFTVANWTTSNPMKVDIDTPNSRSSAFSGTVSFGGWAIDDLAAIAQVAISIDGVSWGTASYGGTRTDVCAAYPNRASCPNVGWNFGLDTTLLSDGAHTLEVTATSTGGQHTTTSASFQVANGSSSPILMFIDAPNSKSDSLSGPATFFGWAIDNNTTLSSVAISIDGVSYGNATYGSARPDVCAAFPGRAGCPNVGWTFVLDTTQLANGSHTVEVTATASTGQHLTASAMFTVQNATAGVPMKLFIDQPNSQSSTLVGVTSFTGWAVDDNAAVNTVALTIDGVAIGNATYGGSRSDVCAAYPGRAGCPNVGWTLSFDTTLIADGPHTLSVLATSAAGDRSSTSVAFTVANWTTNNPMKMFIDVPNAKSGALSGTSTVAGWAMDDIAGISSVAVSVDGVSFGNATYGVNRPDVCAVFPGRTGCPNVGWSYALDTTLIPDGTHTLEIAVTSTGGQRSTTTAAFQVANASHSAVKIGIDSPWTNSTLTGSAAVGGWAVDTSGVTISQVSILVDGVVYGNAGYGGTRMDVCAANPTAGGCPNVGWNFVLDTTVLANGSHTFGVRAVATNGQQATASAPFNVMNVQ